MTYCAETIATNTSYIESLRRALREDGVGDIRYHHDNRRANFFMICILTTDPDYVLRVFPPRPAIDFKPIESADVLAIE